MTRTRAAMATALAAFPALTVATVVPVLAEDLPDGKGKEMVQMICSACHDLTPITGGGFSREDWEAVVKNMIDMGAMIKADEMTVIVDYLASTFPPKSKQ